MQAVGGLLDLVFPRVCGACEAPVGSADQAHLCWDCLRQIQWIRTPLCRRCGNPAEAELAYDFTCEFCRRSEPHFGVARSAARFSGPVIELVHRLKYHGASWVVEDLAGFLEAQYRAELAGRDHDAVTWVPLHRNRRRQRAFNQAAELAAAFARLSGLSLAPRCLDRVRATATQTGLGAAQRVANVRGAFVPVQAAWLDGRRLLIVDDVMTTGATVDECARTLLRAGATCVDVLTVARGVLR